MASKITYVSSYSNRVDKNFLSTLDRKSGIYMISPTRDNADVKEIMVKIGIARNLKHRLGSYLLCYPMGFYIFGLIYTSGIRPARKIENILHEYLNVKGKWIQTRHSHDEEWFKLTDESIHNLFKLVNYNSETMSINKKTNRKVKLFNFQRISIYMYRKRLGLLIDSNKAQRVRTKTLDADVKMILDLKVKKSRKKDRKPVIETQPRKRKVTQRRRMTMTPVKKITL